MKKVLLTCIAVLTALAVMTSCGKKDSEEAPNGAIKIYCADKGMTQINWEYYVPTSSNMISLIDEVLRQFDKNPENELYTRIIPEGVNIEGFRFGDDGQLIIDFNDEYLKMDKLNEVMCRAAIVKTITQLRNVDYVEFYVAGAPLIFSGGTAAGLMSGSDFIDNTGSEIQFRQSVNINVYFADETGVMMTETLLAVESTGVLTQEELALRQLMSGPLEGQTGVKAVIPEGTVLNKVTTRDGIAYVDFSQNFLDGVEGISDEIVIYSVVNTLADISNITKVKFLINGETVKMYGEIPFGGLFERRPELIITEKAGETTE